VRVDASVLTHGTPKHGEDRDGRKEDAPQLRLGAKEREVEQRLAAGAAIDGALPAEEVDVIGRWDISESFGVDPLSKGDRDRPWF
jgi:hypothetical protein